MTNLEKIEDIKESYDDVKNVIPAGKQIETLQLETQIIIAKELCIMNELLQKKFEIYRIGN